MKKIEELSRTELANLTDEVIQKYKQLKCAEEGIPLSMVKPQKPEQHEVDPDILLYQISGINVKTKEQAVKIQDVLRDCEIYTVERNWCSDEYSVERNLKVDRLDIIEKNCYSKERHEQIKAYKAADKDALSEYEDEMEVYKEWMNNKIECENSIDDLIRDARNKTAREAFLREEYKGYLDLSENNASIAFNFLIKAYPDVKDYKELMDEISVDSLV